MEAFEDNKHQEFLRLVRSLEANMGYLQIVESTSPFNPDDVKNYLRAIKVQKRLLNEFEL